MTEKMNVSQGPSLATIAKTTLWNTTREDRNRLLLFIGNAGNAIVVKPTWFEILQNGAVRVQGILMMASWDYESTIHPSTHENTRVTVDLNADGIGGLAEYTP
jgi:hypothetical protein